MACSKTFILTVSEPVTDCHPLADAWIAALQVTSASSLTIHPTQPYTGDGFFLRIEDPFYPPLNQYQNIPNGFNSDIVIPFWGFDPYSLTSICDLNQPVWSQLLWGQSTGVGNRSFGPNNAASASFTGDTSTGPPTLYPNSGTVQNTAAFSTVTPWTGMARLAITASRVNGSEVVTVNVQVNAVSVVSYSLAVASESVNVDFSVEGGTQIDVQVSMQSAGGSQAGTFISGVFSNIF